MPIPDKVKTIANECSEKFPDDIDTATACWMKRVVKLKDFEKWQKELVESAGRHMIADSRHTKAVAIRKQAGHYGQAPKIVPGKTTAIGIMESYFDYPIAGMTLGNVMRCDLLKIANDQQAKSNGYLFNADLCRSLHKRMPDNDSLTVREGVSETVLKNMFDKLKK